MPTKRIVSEQVNLPAGYSIGWSGQYEYMERAQQRLSLVIPVTLMIIVVLLYLNFRNFTEVAIIMGTLPLALVGGLWLLYWLGFNLSVAVGFIALAGVAVEIGIIMIVYLNLSLAHRREIAAAQGRALSVNDIREAVIDGALLRIRPIIMTAATIIVGLWPIMVGTGTGSEVMRRIAAPMMGGMISALLLTLLVIPATYVLWQSAAVRRTLNSTATASERTLPAAASAETA